MMDTIGCPTAGEIYAAREVRLAISERTGLNIGSSVALAAYRAGVNAEKRYREALAQVDARPRPCSLSEENATTARELAGSVT
jgi:hypothetical protein